MGRVRLRVLFRRIDDIDDVRIAKFEQDLNGARRWIGWRRRRQRIGEARRQIDLHLGDRTLRHGYGRAAEGSGTRRGITLISQFEGGGQKGGIDIVGRHRAGADHGHHSGRGRIAARLVSHHQRAARHHIQPDAPRAGGALHQQVGGRGTVRQERRAEAGGVAHHVRGGAGAKQPIRRLGIARLEDQPRQAGAARHADAVRCSSSGCQRPSDRRSAAIPAGDAPGAGRLSTYFHQLGLICRHLAGRGCGVPCWSARPCAADSSTCRPPGHGEPGRGGAIALAAIRQLPVDTHDREVGVARDGRRRIHVEHRAHTSRLPERHRRDGGRPGWWHSPRPTWRAL